MKIALIEYNAFADVNADLGGPDNVFYVQSGGNVSKALALHLASGVYVEAEEINNTVTNFTTAYPAAVEVPFILKGEF